MSSKLVTLAAAWILFCGAAVPDDYVHSFTGFKFPGKVGGFTRTKVIPLTDGKSDVEVDYDNDPPTAHIAVCIYPTGATHLQEQYAELRDAAMKADPGVKLLNEKPAERRDPGVDYHGFRAEFSSHEKIVGEKAQDVISTITLFRRGAYYVMYRAYFVKTAEKTARKEVADFETALAWPPGGTDGAAGTD